MARFFVNRPIVAIVMSIIIVMLGLVAMQGLPIAQYPEIVPPMVQVTTTFIGASATDVEASVATPLEQKINGVEKGIYIKSTNANDGTLTLKVSFEIGSNPDMDNVFTQNRVSEAMPQMPQSVKNYGVTVKKALAFPLLVISIKSPKGTYDSSFLSNYTTININDAIARIPGVGQINLFGGSDYAMRVWLRPDVIGRLGVTIPDIANAISQQNQLTPAGQIGGPPAAKGTEYTYTVRTQGRLLNEEDFGNIIIRTNPDGSEVRLKDVARLELGTMLYNAVGRHDGKPAAVIAVFQIPGTNALDVAAQIKTEMENLSKRFPRDMEYLVSLDTTLPVSEGITEIEHTLFEAVGLVIVVVFIFLQSWRATLIPLMTVPGVARRRVHLLPAARLLDQRALAARPRARHRHRRGRCDRGGRSRDAPHRARDGAEGSDDQGDGGGLGPGDRHRADSERGVRAGGLHGRHHRPAVSAVRHHDRAVGAALGHQRPDAQPGARGDAAQAGDGQEDAPDAVLQRVQPGVRLDDRPVRQLLRHPGQEDVPEPGVHRRADVRDRRAGPRAFPDGFVPEEDQGYIMVNAQLPDAASLERTDAVMKKAEADSREERGHRGLQHHQRLLAAHLRLLLEHGLLLRPAQALGRARDRRGRTRTVSWPP